jgi:hypothetical protein
MPEFNLVAANDPKVASSDSAQTNLLPIEDSVRIDSAEVARRTGLKRRTVACCRFRGHRVRFA